MSAGVLPYEMRLKTDRLWAREDSAMHFDRNSEVYKSLYRLVKRLDELHVPYALVGGLALFEHGFERYTTDVDLLVTPDSLKLIHEKLEGLGYLPPFEGSKHLRDTESGVRVEFLTTGDFPGDGLPKPVAFPDPVNVRVEMKGMWFLNLATLIELKLASGISNPR